MRELTLHAASDAASTTSSEWLDLGEYQDYYLHIDFSGATLAGNLTLESSPDKIDIVTVPSSTNAVLTAASSSYNVAGANYRYVRVKWTPSAGTGNWTVYAVMKATLIIGV